MKLDYFFELQKLLEFHYEYCSKYVIQKGAVLRSEELPLTVKTLKKKTLYACTNSVLSVEKQSMVTT